MSCPPWGVQSPPLGPAYLAEALRGKGLVPEALDANLHFYHWAQRSERDLWRIEKDHLWRDPVRVDALLARWEPKVASLVERLLASRAPVVGFSVVDPNEIVTARLIRRLKQADPGRTVVAGGPACSSPGQRRGLMAAAGGGIDWFLAGEAEESLPRLLLALRGEGDPAAVPGAARTRDGLDPRLPPRPADLSSIAFPTYGEYDLSAYGGESIALLWSRGCVGNCVFCKERALWGPYRVRRAQDILAELAWHRDHSGCGNFVVYDSAVNGNPARLEAVCDAIIFSSLDITWSAEAIPLPSLTRPLLHKMRGAGCHTLVFGVESGSDRVLAAMGKLFTAGQAERVLRDAAYCGIKAAVNILVGFPGEGEQEFRQTLDLIRRNRSFIRRLDAVSNLQVVDDTPLEREADRFGIILPPQDPHDAWSTREGNTLALRRERVERVLELAGELGLEVGRTFLDAGAEKAPLRFRARPRHLLQRALRAGRAGSPVAYMRDLAHRKVSRILGDRGVACSVSPGDIPVLEGIREGRILCGPQAVQIDLTGRCDLSCIACWDRSPLLGEAASSRPAPATLPLETVARLLDDLEEMGGLREIRLSGGEPTLHPDIGRVIRLVKSRPWKVDLVIQTNLFGVGDDLLEQMVEDGVDTVAVSLWAGDAATFIRTHPRQGEEAFRRIVGNLKTLSALRGKGGPRIVLQHVLMNLNHRDLPAMVQVGLETGADEVLFALVDPVPGRTESLLLSPGEMAALREGLLRLQSRVDPFGNLIHPSGGPGIRVANLAQTLRRASASDTGRGAYDRRMVEAIPCYIGWLFARVLADGSVAPCCKGHRMPMGSLARERFRDIWRSDAYQDFRHRALTLPRSDPYFSLMGNELVPGSGCYNCDNLMHNLVCHRKILSRGRLRDWVSFELGQARRERRR